MVKVKNKTERLINLGIVNKQMLYFKPGEEKELPDDVVYSEVLERAEADGFLEVLNEKSFFNKKDKDDKKEEKKSDKDKE